MATTDFTLAELLICTCAEVWRDDGEVLATGTVSYTHLTLPTIYSV